MQRQAASGTCLRLTPRLLPYRNQLFMRYHSRFGYYRRDASHISREQPIIQPLKHFLYTWPALTWSTEHSWTEIGMLYVRAITLQFISDKMPCFEPKLVLVAPKEASSERVVNLDPT